MTALNPGLPATEVFHLDKLFVINLTMPNNMYAMKYALKSVPTQWGDFFSKHLWFAIVIVFLAEMGRIPCCGRPESSSSNI